MAVVTDLPNGSTAHRIYLWRWWRIYPEDLPNISTSSGGGRSGCCSNQSGRIYPANLPSRSTHRIYLWRGWRIRLLLEPERAELDAGVLEGVARLFKCGGRGVPLGSDLLLEMARRFSVNATPCLTATTNRLTLAVHPSHSPGSPIPNPSPF